MAVHTPFGAMTAPQTRESVEKASARQIAAALDQYKRDVEAMIASWSDTERYSEVSQQVDIIRSHRSVPAGRPRSMS